MKKKTHIDMANMMIAIFEKAHTRGLSFLVPGYPVEQQTTVWTWLGLSHVYI